MMNWKIGILVLGAAWLPAPSGDEDGWQDMHEGHAKATPVWTLPKATAPANMAWTVPSMPGCVKSEQFHSAEECGVCHEEIHEQWQGSMMANAWSDPVFMAVYEAYLQKSKSASEKEETAMCSRCHTPVGYLANEKARYLTGELSGPGKEGIHCDVCHSVARSAGVGNGAFILEPGDASKKESGVKYGPRKDSDSPFHGSRYSELHTRSELCGMCHDVAHAHNKMPIESTYTEWRNSPYNTGDPATSTHCQDCHMRQTPEVAATGITSLPNSPGFAGDEDLGAKKRAHVWQHWFVGANAVVPDILDNPDWAAMARDRLSKAATVAITAVKQPVRRGDMLRFDVRVDNVGAGHCLPTGLTYVRQMWLHVTARDRTGKILYESGAVDKNGKIDEDAVIYRTVLGEGGKERKPTFFLPAAVQVLSDKRIQPLGHSVEPYGFLLPPAVEGDVELAVTVRYRSAPQFLINELLGDKAPVLPIFDMATTRMRVAIPVHDR